MSARVYNVLFLCTGNSARSILAEAILTKLGEGRFRAFSAGSQPKGEVHPYALRLMERLHVDTGFARSKSWEGVRGRRRASNGFHLHRLRQCRGRILPRLAPAIR